MTARSRIDLVPFYVAILGLVGTLGALGVSYVLDARRSPCVVASEWLGDNAPNPYISDTDRARVSALMIDKLLECAQ